ncbi:hypothetical protein MKZ38_005036 [Zalerion maritima]|uniref:Lipoprotein n=1 Tax=Zalerion maritima TaxID=339359 RepID=A0AAD5RYB4_9PEZI|nr:hypothetical protein MKZ38_005036 [Zalerion maritima]
MKPTFLLTLGGFAIGVLGGCANQDLNIDGVRAKHERFKNGAPQHSDLREGKGQNAKGDWFDGYDYRYDYMGSPEIGFQITDINANGNYKRTVGDWLKDRVAWSREQVT